MSCVCSMTEIMPKVCKNPYSILLVHSTYHMQDPHVASVPEGSSGSRLKVFLGAMT